jgi:hypothetical protein
MDEPRLLVYKGLASPSVVREGVLLCAVFRHDFS